MTTHVFRKYAGYNPNEIKCWTPSTVIDEKSFDIEEIVFTRGASKAGTSIPSPLARMELFDTAFRIVADDRKDNLKGKTIYHQLVSDVLDMMQMLFNTNNDEIGLGKKIWFKEWRVRENIDKLKSKGESHPNYLLAKSLEQIFFDDKFSSTDSIFLIYYEQKLLGGTSPLTMFFTSPNWSRYVADGAIVNVPKSMDGDVFFDNDYRALHERDKEFVKYIYKLLLQYSTSFNKAEGLRSYINKTITTHFPSWRNDLEFQQSAGENQTAPANLLDANFDKIFTNVDGKLLTINGVYFYHQKQEDIKERIKRNSDFVILATVNKYTVEEADGNKYEIYPPLVLVDNMNVQGDYMDLNSPWDSDNRVKEFYHRNVPLFDRQLPLGESRSITYPFITVDDFIEEVLIELPFAVNSPKFYTGVQGEFRYLLPIKKEYFNFFRFEDLKNQLTVVVNEGQVKVNLKVPIRNKKGVDHILFTKEYKKQSGDIVEYRADIGIFPFYQINDSDSNLQILNDYTVLLAERDEQPKTKSLDFYRYNTFASAAFAVPTKITERSTLSDINSGDSSATSKYFKIKEAFDYLELSYTDDLGNQCHGLIIPNFTNRTFSKSNLTKGFTFAIDFGTSNTHIAYMEDEDALPKTFEVDDTDQQMVLLNMPASDGDLGYKYSYQFPAVDLTLRREFMPPIFSSQSKLTISFPFKTASCEITSFSNTDRSTADLFSHINIGYYIDADERKASNITYTTNLKWLLENNNDDTNKSRVKFFLKQLLLQIRTKAILSNGRPDKLKIVWSVPLSMERGNRTTLNNTFKEAFNEVFGNSGAKLAAPIPESISPYFFLTKSDTDIQSTANVVNIDIGGGTTDVMMFMESSGNRDDRYLTTSFKFAGSDLWGGGYKGKLKDNGFIKNYLSYQKANNITPEEAKYFKKVKDDSNLSSDDLISLLFKYDDKFKFSDSITIGNPNLSIILYLHYSAIIYHIIQVLELKKYPLPRYLSFTGKGSQYVKLICGGDENELEEFTKLLFNAYAKQPVQGSFEIHLNNNPKEITANGSVLYSLADEDETAKFKNIVEFVHPGFDPDTESELAEQLVNNGNNVLCISDTIEADSKLNISVLSNLNLFLDKTLNNKGISDFLGDFKVKNTQEAFEILKWNRDIFNGEGLVYDSFKKVLTDLKKLDKTSELPESLFFFALKDSLYRLSKEIVKK